MSYTPITDLQDVVIRFVVSGKTADEAVDALSPHLQELVTGLTPALTWELIGTKENND